MSLTDLIATYPVRTALTIWLLAISIISLCVCIYDKKVSKKGDVKLRIPEKTLFVTLPLLGGGLAMFLTMLGIRHKTKHWQCYVLVPFFTLLWCAGIFLLCRFGIK